MDALFKKTKLLEHKVDRYLDLINQSGIIFKEGIKFYLKKSEEDFERHLKSIVELEKNADKLRREIEEELYAQTLIPESRGDVLALLENIDHVTNQAKSTLENFSIQMPQIPEEYNEDYLQLTEYVLYAVDSIVSATRAFFREVYAVKDHINKVIFFETEADKTAEKLKRLVFKSNLDLSHKIHLNYFIHHIDLVADYAEDVADRLAIYSLKRSI